MKKFTISSAILPAELFENYFEQCDISFYLFYFIWKSINLRMICTSQMWGHISPALHDDPAHEFIQLFPAQASQELGKDVQCL